MALKILGVSILLMLLLIGGMFAYFRKRPRQIRPGELAKRVQAAVTKHYDRNDNLRGRVKVRVIISGCRDQISDYLKKATVAIEDRTRHGDISGMLRAMLSTASTTPRSSRWIDSDAAAEQVFLRRR